MPPTVFKQIFFNLLRNILMVRRNEYIYMHPHTHKHTHTHMHRNKIKPYLVVTATASRSWACSTLNSLHISMIHLFFHLLTCRLSETTINTKNLRFFNQVALLPCMDFPIDLAGCLSLVDNT